MIRNHPKLRARVSRALLSLIGYENLWNQQGPTPKARAFLDQYGGPMSNDQWIVFQVVWYVWGRPADVKLQEIMQLEAPLLEVVTGLIHALARGVPEVEAWLDRVKKMQI